MEPDAALSFEIEKFATGMSIPKELLEDTASAFSAAGISAAAAADAFRRIGEAMIGACKVQDLNVGNTFAWGSELWIVLEKCPGKLRVSAMSSKGRRRGFKGAVDVTRVSEEAFLAAEEEHAVKDLGTLLGLPIKRAEHLPRLEGDPPKLKWRTDTDFEDAMRYADVMHSFRAGGLGEPFDSSRTPAPVPPEHVSCRSVLSP